MIHELLKDVGVNSVVSVRRAFGAECRGYLLVATDACILLNRFDGFLPGGYVVVRTADVTEIVTSDKWTKMLQAEGYSSDLCRVPEISLHSINSVISALGEQRQNVQIECEHCADAEEAGFHIGRIIRIEEQHFEFLYFDEQGSWFESPYEIPYTSVTLVKFDTPYINTFSKYLAPSPYDWLDGNRYVVRWHDRGK